MRLEFFLRWALPFWCVLAALGPGIQIGGWFRARELARKITQYGPLPEVPITAFDFYTLSLALILAAVAIPAAFGFRFAAPTAFVATVLLWGYYIPGVLDRASGQMWFTETLSKGKSIATSWQMLVYQASAMTCSGALTYLRYFRRPDVRSN